MDKVIKILIAEDFPLLLEEMEDLLNDQKDMQVVGTATSGREIIELAKKTKFDMILMDIEMEHRTAGIMATKEIRHNKPDAKIIYVTVHEDENIILTAMGTGASDYVIKGSSDEDLLHRIRSVYKGFSILDKEVRKLLVEEYSRLQESEQALLFFVNNLADLTKAEQELISYLLKGFTVREMAKVRSVEIGTVKSQINQLLKKLNVSRTKEIVKIINEYNLNYLF